MEINPDSNFHTIAGKSVVDRTDKRYKEYRKKWNEWPHKFECGDFPLHLDVEPSNACNLRCPFCGNTYHRNEKKLGFMKEETWKAIIDESGKNDLYSMKFTFRGEPLVHPDLVKMAEYAKNAGIMDVYFNTNGVLLTEEKIISLIDAGLDRISVSFEGYTKEIYEKYRVGAKFEDVVNNIKQVKRIKDELGSQKPLVRIQTVRIPELAGLETKFADFWSPYVDEVAYLDLRDEEGDFDHRNVIYNWACPQIWQRMTITWDGNILPCVFDIHEMMSFGNISSISIKDAWNSNMEKNYRDLHKKGRAHEIDACNNCPLRATEIAKIRRG